MVSAFYIDALLGTNFPITFHHMIKATLMNPITYLH